MGNSYPCYAMPDLEKRINASREHVIAEIREAFKNVMRGNGVSWLETGVLDDYGTPHERKAARAKDPDRPWAELVDDPSWDPDQGWGGFSFLDAEGFRYYLPPAMLRTIRDVEPQWSLAHHLTLDEPPTRPDRDHRAHTLDKWSLLDKRQRRCVKRFLEFMDARAMHEYEQTIRDHPSHRPGASISPWLTALNSSWASIPDA
jgi:hypothetical protein